MSPVRTNHRRAVDALVAAASRPTGGGRLAPERVARRVERPLDARGAGASLSHLILNRESVRSFAAEPVLEEDLTWLMKLADRSMADRLAFGERAPLLPLLVVNAAPPGLTPGSYRLGELGLARLDPAGAIDPRDFLLQSSLAAAPAAVVLLADLEEALDRRGARGYREALVVAGIVAARMWLAAEELSLGACLSGGVVEDGLLPVVDGYQRTPVAVLCVGHPAGPGDQLR